MFGKEHFPSKHYIVIAKFVNLQPLWPFTCRCSSGHYFSLQNEVSAHWPPIFYIFDTTNLSPFNGKIFRKTNVRKFLCECPFRVHLAGVHVLSNHKMFMNVEWQIMDTEHQLSEDRMLFLSYNFIFLTPFFAAVRSHLAFGFVIGWLENHSSE